MAAKVWAEYATFCEPPGKGELVVTLIGVAAMVRAKTLVPVAVRVSVACAVKLKAPEADGVPDSTPPVLSVMPVGSAPAETAQV